MMKRLVLAAVLTVVSVGTAYAGYRTCTTSCYYGTCTTTCY